MAVATFEHLELAACRTIPGGICLSDTALQGEFAYPMVARGYLVGAIILGPKRSGDPYAPDESDAILHMAHGVGGALDVLSASRHASRDGLLEAIHTMSGDLKALAAEIHALTHRPT